MKRQKSLPRLFKRPCPMFDTGGPLASHLQPPPLPLSSHVSLPFHRDYRTTFVRRIVNDPADHCCSVWTVTGRDWNDHWSNSFDKRSFAKEIWASSESSLNWWSTRLWLPRIQLWLTLIRSLTKDIGGYLGYSTECNKTVESLNKSNRKIEKIIQNVKTLKHCIQRQGFGDRDNSDEKLLSSVCFLTLERIRGEILHRSLLGKHSNCSREANEATSEDLWNVTMETNDARDYSRVTKYRWKNILCFV